MVNYKELSLRDLLLMRCAICTAYGKLKTNLKDCVFLVNQVDNEICCRLNVNNYNSYYNIFDNSLNVEYIEEGVEVSKKYTLSSVLYKTYTTHIMIGASKGDIVL